MRHRENRWSRLLGAWQPPPMEIVIALIIGFAVGRFHRSNLGRRQERVCRAQRLKAKIDAIATSAGGRDRMPRV